jgi:hypothetical protein
MSYLVTIAINQSKFSIPLYQSFIQKCSILLGSWDIFILKNFDLNSNQECEIIHEFLIKGYDIDSDFVSIWVKLKINIDHLTLVPDSNYKFIIEVETGLGRSILALNIQLEIPIIAFELFEDIFVINDNQTKFLNNISSYRSFSSEELKSFSFLA